MLQYAKHLKSEVMRIESQTFSIRDYEVKFEVKLIPADMKWLSTFSGELNNAATYQCPFANVRMDELKERGHSLGVGSEHKWQPWSYKLREIIASKVAKFKKGLKKPINAKESATKDLQKNCGAETQTRISASSWSYGPTCKM